MMKLSALVCARNEEARLDDCLRRLGFADEIVVVLDRCTDGSLAIADRRADVVIAGEFPLEGPRRAAGLQACSGDWVLEIDADEWVGADLAQEVRRTIGTSTFDWHLVPVDNYVGDHLIRKGWGGSFGTSAVARLFRKEAKGWGDQRVHPTSHLSGREGPRLKAAIYHKVDEDISDMVNRLDRYTVLRAHDLADKGKIGSVPSNVFRAFRRFYKCYITRQGWKEGDWGFLIALMSALFPLLSVLRARLELAEQTAARSLATETPLLVEPETRLAA
jgi:glycosyltransferase involved in cell wall biosynthesis